MPKVKVRIQSEKLPMIQENSRTENVQVIASFEQGIAQGTSTNCGIQHRKGSA